MYLTIEMNPLNFTISECLQLLQMNHKSELFCWAGFQIYSVALASNSRPYRQRNYSANNPNISHFITLQS